MFVIRLVARHTSRGDGDCVLHRRVVAIVASQSFVSSVELESSSFIMIIVPKLPIPRIVTVFASGPQLSTMLVAALMAGIAVCGGLVLV